MACNASLRSGNRLTLACVSDWKETVSWEAIALFARRLVQYVVRNMGDAKSINVQVATIYSSTHYAGERNEWHFGAKLRLSAWRSLTFPTPVASINLLPRTFVGAARPRIRTCFGYFQCNNTPRLVKVSGGLRNLEALCRISWGALGSALV